MNWDFIVGYVWGTSVTLVMYKLVINRKLLAKWNRSRRHSK